MKYFDENIKFFMGVLAWIISLDWDKLEIFRNTLEFSFLWIFLGISLKV